MEYNKICITCKLGSNEISGDFTEVFVCLSYLKEEPVHYNLTEAREMIKSNIICAQKYQGNCRNSWNVAEFPFQK